jgi:hypothetical protein
MTKKVAITRLVFNIIFTILSITSSLFSIIIVKDFLWGTVEGWDGLAGIVAFPLSIFATGIVIILTIFNITLLIFDINAFKDDDTLPNIKKINLVALIFAIIGIVLSFAHIVLMFIELIIKR